MQQKMPVCGIQALNLRESTGGQIVEKRALERGALCGRQEISSLRYRDPVMAQIFLKTEGMDHNLPSPPAHCRRDFAAQQRRRRAADENLHVFGIQHSPHEAFPSGYNLDLIEAPGYGLARPKRRETTVVFLQEEVQIPCRQSDQLFVLEVNVGQALTCDSRIQALPTQLMQKSCLACTPHSDHCCGLVRKGNRPVNVASRGEGYRPSERVSQFLDQPRANGFRNHLIHMV